ncbi:MAG: PKD domain-containing protein [Planctomycetota bacterium]
MTIEVDVVQPAWSSGGGPDYAGNFVAAGGVSDSGYAALDVTWGYSIYLQGAFGEIWIGFDADGWHVASGSGAYADLRGDGTYSSEQYVVPNPWLPGTYLWGVRFSLAGTVEFVENVAPIADLSIESADGLTFDFSAAESQDSDGTIVSYEWDVDGDGLYDYWTTSSAIQHTYGASGTYEATVRVTDDRGATDTASVTVTAQAPAPPPEDGKGKGGNGKGGGRGKKK